MDSCPGPSLYLKVIRADGESSILKQPCNAFPTALLLICIRHIGENIKRNLPSSLPEKIEKSILDAIFGTPIKKGLVDCIKLCEFDTKVKEFYFGLTLEKGLDRFVHYFKTHKEGQIRYHVMKGAVLACEFCNDSDRLYNNKIEGINKLIKQWQEYRKADLFTFAKEYEELVRCQESDIQRVFLALDSPYVVKERYSEKSRN